MSLLVICTCREKLCSIQYSDYVYCICYIVHIVQSIYKRCVLYILKMTQSCSTIQDTSTLMMRATCYIIIIINISRYVTVYNPVFL